MQSQPLIALGDVEAGSRWFQRVLALTSGHGGPDYEMLMDGETMVAQLHDWEADEHAHIGDQRSRLAATASCCGSPRTTSRRR